MTDQPTTDQPTTDQPTTAQMQDKVHEIISGARVAMLTHVDGAGRLVANPMATQESQADGTILFLAERTSDQVREIEAKPAVNVTYSTSGAWVSVAGTARVYHDAAKNAALWSTMTDSWLEGGPDNPANVIIEVSADTAEYWDAPGGSTVTQLLNVAKSAVTGTRIEGDNEVVDY